MILPAPPLVLRKRRPRDKRRAQSPEPVIVPLNFLGAENIGPVGTDLEMELVFDTTEADPLNDVSAPPAADANKWSVRYGGVRYSGGLISNVAFDRLYQQLLEGPTEAGPDEISYAGPSDISDVLGRELAAFSDRPLNDEG